MKEKEQEQKENSGASLPNLSNPVNWEEAAMVNPEKYIACLPQGLIYETSGLIDAGELLYQMRTQMAYQFLKKNILDFGCGNGRVLKNLIPYFSQCTGVDISPTMISLARKKVSKGNFMVCDGKTINVPDNSQDIIFTFTVLMHNKKKDVVQIMREFRRILKKGGYLFFQLPCYPNARDIKIFNEVALWTKNEIQQLSSGFEILNIEDEPIPLTNRISLKHFRYHSFRKK